MDDQPKPPNYEAFSKMLRESIAEENQNITHAEFVAGVQSGTLAAC
jgi:hypothetical protein